jgi:hypothetical protein
VPRDDDLLAIDNAVQQFSHVRLGFKSAHRLR